LDRVRLMARILAAAHREVEVIAAAGCAQHHRPAAGAQHGHQRPARRPTPRRAPRLPPRPAQARRRPPAPAGQCRARSTSSNSAPSTRRRNGPASAGTTRTDSAGAQSVIRPGADHARPDLHLTDVTRARWPSHWLGERDRHARAAARPPDDGGDVRRAAWASPRRCRRAGLREAGLFCGVPAALRGHDPVLDPGSRAGGGGALGDRGVTACGRPRIRAAAHSGPPSDRRSAPRARACHPIARLTTGREREWFLNPGPFLLELHSKALDRVALAEMASWFSASTPKWHICTSTGSAPRGNKW
jgi:hypothetical protein